MDLWDLTKMLFRRWYFAVPMLVLSVLTVAVVGTSVSPDYSSKGYVSLIPPVGEKDATGAPVVVSSAANPWMGLGFPSLGQVAIIKVTAPDVLDDLVKAGLTDNVTVTMNTVTPLFTVESIGATPAQAIATTAKVISMLREQITVQQTQYNVQGPDLIRTQVVDDGSKVTTQSSKVKRLLIVAGGLGVLLTVAATIGLDAFLKRRQHRKRMADDPMADAALPRAKSRPASTQRPPLYPPGTNGSAEAPAMPSYAVPGPVGSGPVVSAAGTYGSPVGYDGPVTQGQPRPEPAENGHDPVGVAPDATIVLPLSYMKWSRDDKTRDH